ncbi:MAG TPA: EF-hand domain-containing protein [Xanthobacteraceae bacterium]|nr:EF-hand domain-containing protein [Xanthobacteraceae bacterium]
MTGGNAGRHELLRAEKTAASGINCRGVAGSRRHENPSKYGVLAMARRLLRNLREFCMPLMQRTMSESCLLLALGAASSAIDALKALASSKPPSPASQDAANLFAFSADASATAGSTSGSGPGGGASISPETMSALLAAQSQLGSAAPAPMSRSDALKDLFAQIDADGDGKITKSEFEDALGAGGTNLVQADDVFSKLDKDGDGSVSLDEMASALKGGKGHHRHHRMAGASGDGSDADPLMQALQGATSTSTTNADGSVTTSLTYADGSKVSMTSTSGSSVAGAAASSYNFIEQMIAREAKAISAQTNSSVSVSV